MKIKIVRRVAVEKPPEPPRARNLANPKDWPGEVEAELVEAPLRPQEKTAPSQAAQKMKKLDKIYKRLERHAGQITLNEDGTTDQPDGKWQVVGELPAEIIEVENPSFRR